MLGKWLLNIEERKQVKTKYESSDVRKRGKAAIESGAKRGE